MLLAVGYGLEVIRVNVDQLVLEQQAFDLRPHPGQQSAELAQSVVPQAQVHHLRRRGAIRMRCEKSASLVTMTRSRAWA